MDRPYSSKTVTLLASPNAAIINVELGELTIFPIKGSLAFARLSVMYTSMIASCFGQLKLETIQTVNSN